MRCSWPPATPGARGRGASCRSVLWPCWRAAPPRPSLSRCADPAWTWPKACLWPRSAQASGSWPPPSYAGARGGGGGRGPGAGSGGSRGPPEPAGEALPSEVTASRAPPPPRPRTSRARVVQHAGRGSLLARWFFSESLGGQGGRGYELFTSLPPTRFSPLRPMFLCNVSLGEHSWSRTQSQSERHGGPAIDADCVAAAGWDSAWPSPLG